MNNREENPVTAEGLAAVNGLVDITRNDIAALEQLLIMGTSTEKPILSRVNRLEEKLESLTERLTHLEKELDLHINSTKKTFEEGNERMKKLERLAWMMTGAILIAGTIIQLYIAFSKT